MESEEKIHQRRVECEARFEFNIIETTNSQKFSVAVRVMLVFIL